MEKRALECLIFEIDQTFKWYHEYTFIDNLELSISADSCMECRFFRLADSKECMK